MLESSTLLIGTREEVIDHINTRIKENSFNSSVNKSNVDLHNTLYMKNIPQEGYFTDYIFTEKDSGFDEVLGSVPIILTTQYYRVIIRPKRHEAPQYIQEMFGVK